MNAPMANRLPLLSFLLLLSCLLLAAPGAHGAALESASSTPALEGDFEGLEAELEEESEGEEVEAGCEEAEVEFELGEISEAESEEICREAAESREKKGGRRGSAGTPEECILRSTHAHAAVNEKRDTLKLTLGYTAYEPVGARIEVRKGSSRIATLHRQLGRSGVLRIVKSLGDGKAPKRLVVRLAVPASPAYCGKYQTERVRVH
jgi:hypothetical protein